MVARGQADYVIAAKGNQASLHDTMQAPFAAAHASSFADVAHDRYQTEATQHDRWERRVNRKTSCENRFSISSLESRGAAA